MTAVNSTLAGNAAHTGIGGGIYNVTSGMVTVINGTVFDNSGYTIGGGITNYGTLTIGNTIVAGNSANFDDGIQFTPALAVLANIYGEVTANYTLIGDTGGATISGATTSSIRIHSWAGWAIMVGRPRPFRRCLAVPPSTPAATA